MRPESASRLGGIAWKLAGLAVSVLMFLHGVELWLLQDLADIKTRVTRLETVIELKLGVRPRPAVVPEPDDSGVVPSARAAPPVVGPRG